MSAETEYWYQRAEELRTDHLRIRRELDGLVAAGNRRRNDVLAASLIKPTHEGPVIVRGRWIRVDPPGQDEPLGWKDWLTFVGVAVLVGFLFLGWMLLP